MKHTHDDVALLIADLYEAAGASRRWGERLAGAVGQSQARWQLLSVLSDGQWTVPGAAERLGTSRQAVQRIANDLVAEQLAEYVDNPNHRRSPFVHLTASGRTALERITIEAAAGHATLAKQLADVDLPSVRDALRRLTDSVRQLPVD